MRRLAAARSEGADEHRVGLRLADLPKLERALSGRP
jgi:hypothetical protein